MENNNKQSSIAKKTLIYMTGNFSSRLLGMLIIPIYAKYLTASDLGNFDFQQTMGNLLMPIMALAIWESILRFGLNTSEKKTNEVIMTSIVISFVTIAISGVVLLATYIQIYGISINTLLYVALIVTMPIVTILGYISRTVRKNKVYAISGVVSAFVNIAFVFLFVVIKNYGVTGLLLSSVGANIFNIIYLILGTQLVKRLKLQYFSVEEAKILVGYSIPLIFNLTFGWFLNSFSRFYINLSLGASVNGLYAFASKFSGIFLQLSSILNMSVIEDAVESIDTPNWKDRFENNIDRIGKVYFEFSSLLMIVTSIYYYFVSNIEFKESLILVPLLLLSGILTSYSILIGNVFPVFKETKKIFITSLISGVSNILLVLVLSSTLGLIGIAIAQILSSFILLFVRYIFAQRLTEIYINKKRFFSNLLVYIFVSLLVMKLNMFGRFIILFFYCSYLLKIYWKSIFVLINKYKMKN